MATRRKPPAESTPARAVRTQARSARTRAALIEAAFELVAQKGLEGLRTRDVAARAEVNIATLHYHFATKDALLDAVLARLIDAFKQANQRTTRATLRDDFRATLDAFTDHPGLALVLQEMSLRAHRDPRLRAAFRGLFAGWNGAIEQLMAQAIADGHVPAQLDPGDLARAYTAFIIGATIQSGLNPKGFDVTELGTRVATSVARVTATLRRSPAK